MSILGVSLDTPCRTARYGVSYRTEKSSIHRYDTRLRILINIDYDHYLIYKKLNLSFRFGQNQGLQYHLLLNTDGSYQSNSRSTHKAR